MECVGGEEREIYEAFGMCGIYEVFGVMKRLECMKFGVHMEHLG